MTRCIGLVMMLGLLLSVPGCGHADGKSEVSGQVIFDGQPVQAGMISFESTEVTGPPRNAPIQEGSYHATLEPGSYLVRITASASPPTSPASIDEAIHEAQEYVPLLPEEWNRDSELVVEVPPGTATVNFRGNAGEAPTVETDP